jgi:hypothetical protein
MTLRKRNKCFILAVPALAVLLVYAVYMHGVARAKAQIASISELECTSMANLQKCLGLVAERPDLENKLASLRESRKAEDTKLIDGSSPALAAANLQNIVKGKIVACGGTVSSERVEKPEDTKTGKLKLITISLDATVPDVGALNSMLYALETSTPCISIRDMECRIIDWKEPKKLSVRLKISALMTGK